ncbi:BTB/POZ and MATH domain-containing protein 2-like [Lolium perenne]|uniref:BTB/POZ and MATH domain-containing protein 2-like n=1 Tax=Lolium perenne TaxID=4522 RepID=UPI0021F5DF6F|nr:BTB/POZ and MATH domain-containing protein 2-like [Lolium perenne]
MASPRSSESTCTAQTIRGTHQFEVVRYSLHKGTGVRKFVTSGAFTVGGYKWAIRYYPDGESSNAFVSVYVVLTTKNARARALLRLIDRTTGLSCSVYRRGEVTVFAQKNDRKCARGIRTFMCKTDLEASPYLRDDRLTVECVLDVVQDAVVTRATPSVEVVVPVSDLPAHLGRLLEEQEGVDITFDVMGEMFHAHKIVLAMRSAVFKAQLYGPMREKDARLIVVGDMQPLVFKALLHFVYTDALLVLDDLAAEEYRDLMRHLLEAADRYAMERLKLVCELVLGRTLDTQTVTTTLALADQHCCKGLKDVCVQFMSSVGLKE